MLNRGVIRLDHVPGNGQGVVLLTLFPYKLNRTSLTVTPAEESIICAVLQSLPITYPSQARRPTTNCSMVHIIQFPKSCCNKLSKVELNEAELRSDRGLKLPTSLNPQR
ncbi:hypothetical protein AMTRI_Chr08g205900 [Amborella trichopoda]